jgi:hypothetical protein
MSSELVIIIVTLLVWALWVLRPAIQVFRSWLPNEDEWMRVRGEIKSLQRDLVDETEYHSNTKQALKLVLTREAGYGRVAYVPLALDVIQAPADQVSRTCRALSAQSIVLGLVGTVLTFAFLFGSHQLATGNTTAPIAQTIAMKVLEHLSGIYFINTFAIIAGFVLYHRGWVSKQRGDRAGLAATEAFAELTEGGDASLAPELAAALERTAQEFRRFSESLFNDQFAKIERLLGQVKGLGDGIRELVKETVAQNKKDQGVLQAQLRENSTAVERVTQRLDDGFKLLAQPFIQGIPAMQTVSEASEQLKLAADAFVKADLSGIAGHLGTATVSLEEVLRQTPSQVAEGVLAAGVTLRDVTREALQASLHSAFAEAAIENKRFMEEIVTRVGSDLTRLEEKLAEASTGLQQTSTVSASELKATLGRIADRFETAQDTVRETLHDANADLVQRIGVEIDRAASVVVAGVAGDVGISLRQASAEVVAAIRARSNDTVAAVHASISPQPDSQVAAGPPIENGVAATEVV